MTKSCYESQKTRNVDYIHNSSNDITVRKGNQVNNKNTYYYNTAQRLRAKNLSFERNLPSQKNSKPCQSDDTSCDTSCYIPINKQQYGTKCKFDGTVPVSSSSGARTFALAKISTSVKKDIKIIENSNKLWYKKSSSCPTQIVVTTVDP